MRRRHSSKCKRCRLCATNPFKCLRIDYIRSLFRPNRRILAAPKFSHRKMFCFIFQKLKKSVWFLLNKIFLLEKTEQNIKFPKMHILCSFLCNRKVFIFFLLRLQFCKKNPKIRFLIFFSFNLLERIFTQACSAFCAGVSLIKFSICHRKRIDSSSRPTTKQNFQSAAMDLPGCLAFVSRSFGLSVCGGVV